MSFVDRRIAPKVEVVILAALLALWHRCPECGQLDVSDLALHMPRAPQAETKQISLRLPGEWHELLKASADQNRRSLHAEILWRLEQPEEDDQGEAHE